MSDLENLHKAMFNALSDLILLINPEDFTVIEANAAILEKLKMKKEEVIGKTCYALTHRRSTPCEPPNDICPLSELMKTGREVTVEHIHYDSKGTPFYAQVTVCPVKDAYGRMVQVVHITKDITERKGMEEDLRKLNETLAQRLLQKTSQIENILKIGDLARKTPDITTGMKFILEGALNDLDLDVGAVLIIDHENNIIRSLAFRSKIERTSLDESYPLNIELAEMEAAEKDKSFSRILRRDEQSVLKTPSIHCIPMHFGKRMCVCGILAFGSQRGTALTDSELDFLGLYAELASRLFENQSLIVTPVKETGKTAKRKFKLEFGHSYLVENNLEKAFEIFADNVHGGLEGLCITREFPPKIRRMYGLEKTLMVWLKQEKAEGQTTVHSLQDVSILIANFLGKAKEGIVLLDGFEYLITNHTFESFILFLQLTKNRFEQYDGILVAPLLKNALDIKERALIKREMRSWTFKDLREKRSDSIPER